MQAAARVCHPSSQTAELRAASLPVFRPPSLTPHCPTPDRQPLATRVLLRQRVQTRLASRCPPPLPASHPSPLPHPSVPDASDSPPLLLGFGGCCCCFSSMVAAAAADFEPAPLSQHSMNRQARLYTRHIHTHTRARARARSHTHAHIRARTTLTHTRAYNMHTLHTHATSLASHSSNLYIAVQRFWHVYNDDRLFLFSLLFS